jgi:acyl dehydratase
MEQMMTDKKWAYEDLEVGLVLGLGSKTVTSDEIVEFAREFDPQPMHLDEAAGKAGILGGLSASGWHTCSIYMRLICDAFILQSTSEGSPGIEYVRWKKPVRPGDVLTGHATITTKRRSKSRPDLGFANCRGELQNQRGEIVLEVENTGMFLLRHPEAVA